MRGIGTLLSAVSVGITDRAEKLYLLGIIFGDFCPVRPALRSGSIADRGKGISLFLFGLGIISGRFLTLLFMLFLSARLAVVHLGKIAFHGLQLPDTLFL